MKLNFIDIVFKYSPYLFFCKFFCYNLDQWFTEKNLQFFVRVNLRVEKGKELEKMRST